MSTKLAIHHDCGTCDHKKCNNDPELHCYMFKVPPEGPTRCAQHSRNKLDKMKPTIAMLNVMATTLAMIGQSDKYPPAV
jgi:hypothetical protein